MEEITVTVKNLSGDFKKTTEVSPDMLLGDFLNAAKELANLSNVPCTLVLEKNNKAMKDNDTFQSAGIKSGSVFVLTPEAEGG
jgi:hypothetical protein